MKLSDIPPEEFAHFGVKGQKWGVRNERKSSNSPNRTPEETAVRRAKQKKAAIVAGTVITVALVSAGAIYAKKHMNVDIKDAIPSDSGKKAAERIAKEPTEILHTARGKHIGYTFLQRGGLNDPGGEFLTAGFGDGKDPGFFTRYGDALEKVAGTFADPEGRTDFAGRGIVHDVILPRGMSEGVTDVSGLQRVSWPLLKDTFQEFYNQSLVPGATYLIDRPD